MRLIDADAFAEWVHYNTPADTQDALITKSFVMAGLRTESITPTVAMPKDQEPRLYAFDEVLHLPADTTLWLEEVDEPNGAIIPTAYTGASFRGDPAEISDSDVIYVCFYGRVMNTCDGYNRYWRCWTSKPTDEQRKAVKWHG